MAVTATTPELGSLELVRKPRSLWRDAFRRLSKNKMAVASAIIILAVILIAISAPLLPLHDPIGYHSRATDQGGGGTRLPPAWEANGNPKFPLGTDGNG